MDHAQPGENRLANGETVKGAAASAARVSIYSTPAQSGPARWVRERPDLSTGAGATLFPKGRLSWDALVVSHFEAPPQKLKLLSKRTDFS